MKICTRETFLAYENSCGLAAKYLNFPLFQPKIAF